jgi:hypothetical protein
VFDAATGTLGFADAAATGPALVVLRDPAALPGLRDLAPAMLQLDLVADASALSEADAMLGQAFDMAFAGLALRDVVTLAMFLPGGLRLRRVVPALKSVECVATAAGADSWVRTTATLRSRRQLETLITLPAPAVEKGLSAAWIPP